MCGIVGYVGENEAVPILLRALKRLEYRGYDSAGLAVVGNELSCFKDKGMIDNLQGSLPPIKGKVGLGHTRWATHGKPSKENAHPFLDCEEKIAVIHNGIIENHMELRKQLIDEGHTFTSETDTEVLAHLIEKHYNGNLEKAVLKSLKLICGSYAIACVHGDEKDNIIAARNESPLVVGIGNSENFIASDVAALLDYTNKVAYVMDNEVVRLTKEEFSITTIDGEPVSREVEQVNWTVEDAEKGGYEHYMLKEIFEQPIAVHNSLLGRIPDLTLNGFLDGRFNTIKIIACGTSYHAGLIGKYIFENFSKVPVVVEMGSEYRYSEPTYENTLIVLITQSGETADTVAAAREAKRRGSMTIAITNVVGSSITREVDYTFYTRAGPEIGVAATKTFTTQLIALYILGIALGLIKGTLKYDRIRELTSTLRKLPRYMQSVLDDSENIEKCAMTMTDATDVFYIGRNINYPTALEGALKFKEISYIHAEGYPAGELKHGPLALLTPQTPVVAIAPRDHTYEKMLGNISEVSARGSPVIAIGFQDDTELSKLADQVIFIPEVPALFSPVPITVVVQLLAYYVARERKCSIDRPRHLAKSVTVE
ncbi:MAG: glutamine--fructose-6-phosphate transaminase (isomerizing) [Methanomassiliicoccales archaeon]|nr:MAG: glutamine--fructose-6-phosphate transaminase (isomerizing) [Methanomassiliicoccales archaeon]